MLVRDGPLLPDQIVERSAAVTQFTPAIIYWRVGELLDPVRGSPSTAESMRT